MPDPTNPAGPTDFASPASPSPGSPADPLPPPHAAVEPVAADEAADVDPELERLPLAPRRRRPLTAMAVLVLAAVLLWHLQPDLRYAASARLPRPLGNARDLRFGDGSGLRDNTLVELTGQPDFRNALLFEPRGDSYRRAFFRLLGTGGRLWVRAEQTSTRHDLDERLVGRLRRFDTLPYAEQVRTYYGTLPVTRLLDPAPFRTGGEALRAGLRDRGGEPVPVADPARTEVAVVVEVKDELVVTLPREHFAVEEDARREVERLGALVGPVLPPPPEGPPGSAEPAAETAGFAYPVRVEPAARNALLAACEERGFAVRLRRLRLPLPLSSLLAAAPAERGVPVRLVAGGPALYGVEHGRLAPLPAGPGAPAVVVPWEQIDSLQIDAPVEIPHDAWVLIERDLPEDYGWAVAVAAVLLVFAGWNAWWLTRSRPGR